MSEKQTTFYDYLMKLGRGVGKHPDDFPTGTAYQPDNYKENFVVDAVYDTNFPKEADVQQIHEYLSNLDGEGGHPRAHQALDELWEDYQNSLK